MPPHQILYSEKYFDDVYEYRHAPSLTAGALLSGKGQGASNYPSKTEGAGQGHSGTGRPSTSTRL